MCPRNRSTQKERRDVCAVFVVRRERDVTKRFFAGGFTSKNFAVGKMLEDCLQGFLKKQGGRILLAGDERVADETVFSNANCVGEDGEECLLFISTELDVVSVNRGHLGETERSRTLKTYVCSLTYELCREREMLKIYPIKSSDCNSIYEHLVINDFL